MKTFEVTIRETTVRTATIEIEADDWEQAEELARSEYYAGIDFDDEDEDLEIETEEV